MDLPHLSVRGVQAVARRKSPCRAEPAEHEKKTQARYRTKGQPFQKLTLVVGTNQL